MSKRKKPHRENLTALISRYARVRALEFYQYSPYHLRLIDPGLAVIDCWTTGKYYVRETNYCTQANTQIIERGGEKGWLPTDSKLEQWLDTLFYAADLEHQQ